MTKPSLFPAEGARILVVGAASAIVERVCRRFAVDKAQFFLIGRDGDRLTAIAEDLRVRGAVGGGVGVGDLSDEAAHAGLIDQALAVLGGFDAVLVGHGTLTDQTRAVSDPDYALREIELNFLSYVSIVLRAEPHVARGGVVTLISSVAGDRGRASNYVYGAAKAGVSVFGQGLEHQLSRRGVRVVTVKPGFVDTPMTKDFKKGPLWASADAVAEDIAKAMRKGSGPLYTPWFWRWILLGVRSAPRAIFHRTKL